MKSYNCDLVHSKKEGNAYSKFSWKFQDTFYIRMNLQFVYSIIDFLTTYHARELLTSYHKKHSVNELFRNFLFIFNFVKETENPVIFVSRNRMFPNCQKHIEENNLGNDLQTSFSKP